jgi:hypothetical protein
MSDHSAAHSATTEGITISPGLDLVAESAQTPPQYAVIDRRVLQICAIAIVLAWRPDSSPKRCWD